jgi:hypothetical protein
MPITYTRTYVEKQIKYWQDKLDKTKESLSQYNGDKPYVLLQNQAKSERLIRQYQYILKRMGSKQKLTVPESLI